MRASKDGTAHMYVFDPSDPSTGKHISVPATTMKGGANSNLISAWHLVNQAVRFYLHAFTNRLRRLQPNGTGREYYSAAIGG